MEQDSYLWDEWLIIYIVSAASNDHHQQYKNGYTGPS